MYKVVYISLFSSLLGLFFTNPVFATDDFLFTVDSLPKFEIGQYPFVTGNAVTLDKKPVSDVQIQINFPSEQIRVSTNSTGQFYAKSTIPAEIGEYDITFYARKDNKVTDTQITYKVLETVPTKSFKVTDSLEKSNKVSDGNIELDPFTKMIKNLEEQKTDEAIRKEITKEQQQIDEQRIQNEIKLQKDLKDSEKRTEYYTPRNVFYRFIADIDSSVRAIFWQQFLFTEDITNHARDAKENALDEGKSSHEAMKIFQDKAKVTKKEIMNLNKNVNVKYGNATDDTQDQFDENGKITREE